MVSSVQGLAVLVTVNVVPLPAISADGVTLVPDHVFTDDPKT